MATVVDVTPTQVAMDVESAPAPTKSGGVAVTMKDLKYTVKGPKKSDLVILDGVSGLFKPGCMTALMGPSGSGKTTLLDVVSSRKNTGKIEGEILYGGKKLTKSTLRDAVGYVEQFVTLVGELSVRQMLQKRWV